MFNVHEYIERRLPVQCVAHRGYSGMYPENTLLAFREAIKIGADMIEFDVRVSGDGVPVVIHDPSVDRTTNGHGLVKDLTLEELKKLDAGLGEKIPTLQETLNEVAGKIGLNIHVKVTGKVLDKVIRMLYEYDIVETAFLAIEDKDDILRIKKQYSDIHVCSLWHQTQEDYLEASKPLGVRILQPMITSKYFSKEWIDKVHSNSIVTCVFWANTFSEVRNIIKAGADAILTDFPTVCLKYRDVIRR
ncbi:MAG: hypothetical protein DRJ64_02485 [Thermoprotei archaeon]|nr:MAG: hypothetical protein DRJ64_02485 [Thermoprotei archaeon]